MLNSFKAKFKKLSLMRKIVLIGGTFTFISAFLPWYKDIDRFNTGDTFLGITGPLYLAGLILVVAAAMSAGYIYMDLFEKKTPRLPVEEKHFHIASASAALLMLVLASSVYFHPRFGINLSDKTMGIGMMMGFTSSGVVLLGALFANKKTRNVSLETDSYLEEVVEEERAHVAVEPVREEIIIEPVAESVREEVPVSTIAEDGAVIQRPMTVGDARSNAEEEKKAMDRTSDAYSGGKNSGFSVDNPWGGKQSDNNGIDGRRL